MSRVYALLVGIDAYPSAPLAGCLNDVDRMAALLRQLVPPQDLALEVLKESDATHANISRLFRQHLGQAGAGDAACFHFAGHGCQAASAPEFKPFFASGRDEGLVCWDTHPDNGLLLADKELAVLVHDVAARQAHVTVMLDCCHSGSGTRDIGGADSGIRVRAASPLSGPPRALESYAGGHYARQRERGEPLAIPEGRHILLAACDRLQTAQEDTASRGGLFTTALLEVLQATGGQIAYADLFRRVRQATRVAAAQRPRATPQDPQFEPAAGFDAGSGFLGRSPGQHRPRYFVAPQRGGWRVECGALHGLPVDAASPVTFQLYREGAPDQPAGTASATRVRAQCCEIAPDFDTGGARAFMAELTSLPAPPLVLGFSGASEVQGWLQQALEANRAVPVMLAPDAPGNVYRLQAREGQLALWAGTRLIRQGEVASPAAATAWLPVLAHVARWERLKALDNPRSALDRGSIALQVALDGAAAPPDALGVIEAGFVQAKRVFRFSARNGTALPWLHMVLVYFADDFSIQVRRAEPVPAGGTQVLHEGVPVYLNDDEAAADFRFKLLVATEAPDAFLLEQPGLAPGEPVGGGREMLAWEPEPKVIDNDWLSLDVTLRLRREGPATITGEAGGAG